MNNPEEIQHFIDVLIKEDSFVKAAKKLYISQPYLTQLIKRIESHLGTPIINRDKKPYSLTQAGLLYYQYLENVSYDKQQLNKKIAKYTALTPLAALGGPVGAGLALIAGTAFAAYDIITSVNMCSYAIL